MNAAIPAVLLGLSMADAAFAGYRDAAGRDARVFKVEYYRRAIRRGLKFGLVTNACALVTLFAFAASSSSLTHFVQSFTDAAQTVLCIVGCYAVTVIAALGVWVAGEADVRTLASVLILGPFTLIRPWVIAGAAAAGAWAAPSSAAAVAVVLVCGMQMLIEPLLGRAWRQ